MHTLRLASPNDLTRSPFARAADPFVRCLIASGNRSAPPFRFIHRELIMPNRFIKKSAAFAAIVAAAIALQGCAVALPPPPASNPADIHAPESASAPLHPALVATSRTFFSPDASDPAERQMEMSKTKAEAISPNEKKIVVAPGEAYFTCPMHSEIHQAKPGQCPICGMTLVEKSSGPGGVKP